MLKAKVVVAALLLTACQANVHDEPVMGPERFEFAMILGEGAGARAHEIVGEMSTPGSDGHGRIVAAQHIAWVDAPGGRVDFVLFDTVDQGMRESCLASMQVGATSSVGGIACGPFVLGPGTSIAMSASNGVWKSLLVRTPGEVTLVTVTTTTGGEYVIRPAAGLAYAEWPVERGEAKRVAAFDSEGNEIWSDDL